MYEFGEKHPIAFEFILIIVSFVAAGIIVAACSIVNMQTDLSTSIARVLVAMVLLLIYRRAFKGQNPLANPVIVIPSLLFAVWNIFYNLSSGLVFGGSTFFIEGAITAIAVHFLIDFTTRIYQEQATSASNVHLVVFAVLLAAEAAYAVKLTLSGQPAKPVAKT